MYSKESLKKVVNKLNSAIKECKEKLSDLHVCISKGNRKIGKVMNVSIAPIITCANCSGCMHLCYDIKAVLQYVNVLKARARNTAIALYDRERFFREIDDAMNRRQKNKFFRWHVSGDIIDFDYFCHMVEIARNHPDFVIWTYTKNYAVVNAYCKRFGRDAIPMNFTIMFSEWRGMPLINPYSFPVFTVRFHGEPAPKMHKCPGNCDICKELHRGCVAGENTYCDEH